MRMKNNGFTAYEPPTLISDINGEIVFVNSKASNLLYPIKVGDSVTKYVDLDYIKKISLLENRVDVVVPKNCNFERLVVKSVGTGITKTVELTFLHAENDVADINDDKRLFATYSEVIGANVVGNVMLKQFVESIVECIHADFRFAYRKFGAEKAEEGAVLYTNFSHLCAIAVSAIITLNEIEYRNPIEISVKEVLGEFVLEMSVRKNTFAEAKGLYELTELFPRVAMRLMYVTALCDNDGISYDFCVKPNRVSATFVISNMINETGRFAYSFLGSEQNAYISHIIDLLLPMTNDIIEEERE